MVNPAQAEPSCEVEFSRSFTFIFNISDTKIHFSSFEVESKRPVIDKKH